MNREREAEGGSRTENEPAIDSGGGFVRLRLDIAYDGTEFAGWAVQAGQRTVAGTVDGALSTVFRTPVRLRAAGRTDAGVHATGQVAHVDVPADALAHAYPRTARTGDGEFLPLVQSASAKKLFEIYVQSAADTGFTTAGEFTGGCADSGFTAGVGAPTICAVGPVGGKAHSPDEFLRVDSMVPRAQACARAIIRLERAGL